MVFSVASLFPLDVPVSAAMSFLGAISREGVEEEITEESPVVSTMFYTWMSSLRMGPEARRGTLAEVPAPISSNIERQNEEVRS